MKMLAVCLVLSLVLSTFVVDAFMGCANQGDRCQLIGGRQCCMNMQCRQSLLGGYRCQRSNGGGNIGCIRRGNRCQLYGTRRCCSGRCRSMGGYYSCY